MRQSVSKSTACILLLTAGCAVQSSAVVGAPQTNSRTVQCERLWPTLGGIDEYLTEEMYELRQQRLRHQLHSQDPSSRQRLVQMVRDDIKDNAEAVYIVEDETVVGGGARYTVVYVRATRSASTDPATTPPDQAAEVVRRAPIDESTVTILQSLWRTMISEARYPAKARIDLIGAHYSFLAELDLFPGAARTEGPAKGSCPDALISIGRQLMEYTARPVAERAQRAAKLREDANTLLIRLGSMVPDSSSHSNVRR